MNSNRRRYLASLGATALILTLTTPLVANGDTGQGHGSRAKYVFFFVGDGMAIPQVNAAEIYKNASANSDIKVARLSFTQFPTSGLTTTYDAGSFITDSASAMTAMMTGHKTLSGVINMDTKKTEKYKTIAEYAKEGGYKVGVVSSVSLDHATPAATYAKVASRGEMYSIDVQLAGSSFDYFGGGGLTQKGKKDGDADVFDLARKNGFTVVSDKATFEALKPGVGKVLAHNKVLQDESALSYEMDRSKDDLSLADYTRKGIELLDNPKGFFMVIEGGKIDWACHANDASAAIKDTLALDDAVVQAVQFADAHPNETLIVVTGDHETGGMTIGFSGTKYSTFFDKIALQKGSYIAFNDKVLAPYKKTHSKDTAKIEDITADVEKYFGIKYKELHDADKELLDRAFRRSLGGEVERVAQENIYNLYGSYEPLTVALTHILNQQAGIGWTSYSHTGVPVATFARGPGENLFAGYYDNTDIFKKLSKAMELPVPVTVAAK
ncbi:MAG: alkaline phosphatase [Desulforhopalus sp.]|nr:alkaline phosphatase [Desulforhopalus sp.]